MNKHSQHSSFREKLIEHLFVGELLKLSWLNGDCLLEIARPEVDNAGCDVIAEHQQVVRHIQLKASYIGGRTSRQNIHTRLADKQSRCVVWIYFDEATLKLGPYLFFGGAPGETLPCLANAPFARHTKGDQHGHKSERQSIRVVNKGQFTQFETIDLLHAALFGKTAQSESKPVPRRQRVPGAVPGSTQMGNPD